MHVPVVCNSNKILPAIFREDIPPPTRCLSSSPSCGCIPCSAPLQPWSQTVLLRNYPGLEEFEHCVITQCDCWNTDRVWQWLLKGEGKLHFLETKREPFPSSELCSKPATVRLLVLLFQLGRTSILGYWDTIFFKSSRCSPRPALLLLQLVLSTQNQVIQLPHLCVMGLWQGPSLTSPPSPSELGWAAASFRAAWRSNCSFSPAWPGVLALPSTHFRAGKCHFVGLVPWRTSPPGTLPIPALPAPECLLLQDQTSSCTQNFPFFEVVLFFNNHINK